MNSQEIDELINALQLSIDTKIQQYKAESGTLLISFANKIGKDNRLKDFILISGAQVKKDRSITLSLKEISPHLTGFLMLSRLAPKYVQKITELDTRFEKLAEKITQAEKELNPATILSIEQASQIIEQTIKRKKMTLRELSQKTGLTQVSLSHFKSGKDIRLSNFLKIAEALDLKVTIQ